MVEKELFYEQAVHVPLILKHPETVPKNKEIHEFVESIDILPTVMQAAGIRIPAAVQGRSLFPLMDGSAEGWRQEVFAEWNFQYYHCRRLLGLAPDQCKATMIRDQHWKYVHYSDQPCELYDLDNDPAEFKNLAEKPEFKDRVKKMRERILNWRMRSEDPTPDVDLTFATYLRDPWES